MAKFYTLNDVFERFEENIKGNSKRFKLLGTSIISGAMDSEKLAKKQHYIDDKYKIIVIQNIFDKMQDIYFNINIDKDSLYFQKLLDASIESHLRRLNESVPPLYNEIKDESFKDQKGIIDIYRSCLKLCGLFIVKQNHEDKFSNALNEFGQSCEQKVTNMYKNKINGLEINPSLRTKENQNKCLRMEYDRISNVLENLLIKYSC